MTPDNIDTEALRALTRLALAVEDPPSAAQLRAIRALADAAPAMLATVEAQRKEIEELERLVNSGAERSNGFEAERNALESERDALKAEVERLRAALAKWPSVMCPCCGDEAAFAMFFEDGQPTICGCGGTVMADGNASVYIATDDGLCENHKRAALRGEEASRE